MLWNENCNNFSWLLTVLDYHVFTKLFDGLYTLQYAYFGKAKRARWVGGGKNDNSISISRYAVLIKKKKNRTSTNVSEYFVIRRAIKKN